MFCYIKQKNKDNNSGLTLIEMLVAIAVFSIIIVSAISIFIYSIKIQKYCLSYQNLLSQMNYVMEYMTRSIRMAKKDLNGDCTGINPSVNKYNYILVIEGGLEKLKFETYNSGNGEIECREFYLSNKRIYQKIGAGQALPLTSDNIEISSFFVYLSGEKQDDDLQPRVTVTIETEGLNSDPKPKMKIQTTVSQRDFDIKE